MKGEREIKRKFVKEERQSNGAIRAKWVREGDKWNEMVWNESEKESIIHNWLHLYVPVNRVTGVESDTVTKESHTKSKTLVYGWHCVWEREVAAKERDTCIESTNEMTYLHSFTDVCVVYKLRVRMNEWCTWRVHEQLLISQRRERDEKCHSRVLFVDEWMRRHENVFSEHIQVHTHALCTHIVKSRVTGNRCHKRLSE